MFKLFFSKIFLPFKVAVLMLAFIFLGNFIASQSGITNQLSKIFYWEEPGAVLGEFTVHTTAAVAPVLGVSGDKFTINGTPKFLLGVSLFDALNETDANLDQDLAYLEANHYNLIRVWADWQWQEPFESTQGDSHCCRNSTVYDTGKRDGSLNNTRFNQLINVIDQAANRGIVVEVVITDFNPSFYNGGDTSAQRLEKHKTAARNITQALSGKTNVFFDLMNEHDNDGTDYLPFPNHADIKQIADAVASVDSSRIVTVSNRGRNSENSSQIQGEVSTVGVDAYTPHFDRGGVWYDLTDDRVNSVRGILQGMNPARNIPIYLSEEANYPDGGSQTNFVTAAINAKNAGAAGWNFHQTYGFNLKNDSFYNQAGNSGRATLEAIGAAIGGGGSGGGCRYQTISGNWSAAVRSDFKEYTICDSAASGYVEFTVSGIALSNMPQKTAYALATVLDKSTVSNVPESSQNPNYATITLLGQGYGGTYPGQIHYRSNINNDCASYACHPQDDGQDGARCSDDEDRPNDACPMAWEIYEPYPGAPWENKNHRFKIEWGGGHLIYSYLNNGNWIVLKNWNPGDIPEPKYKNFSWLPNSMVLRLGDSTIYGGIPGAIYSNIVVKTGGSSPPPNCSACGAWQNAGACGTGGCGVTQMYQIRSGCPSGAGCSTSQCVTNSSCGPSCTVGAGCTTSQNCSGTYNSSCACIDVPNDNCPSGGGGQTEIIKVDTGAKNPAVAVDSIGNLHFAYDCHTYVHSKGIGAHNACYRKVYSENGEIKMSAATILTEGDIVLSADPRIAIDNNDNVHIMAGGRYAVVVPSGQIFAQDFAEIDNARLAIDKNSNNAFLLYRAGRYGGIMLKKISFDGTNINEIWTKTINPACPKPQMPGNVVIDNHDVGAVTWRQFGDHHPVCPGRNIQYAQFDIQSGAISGQREVFGTTSDFSDMVIGPDGRIHFIAVSARGVDGLWYKYIDNNTLSPSYKLLAPGNPGTNIILDASNRFGEANVIGPYMSFDKSEELYLSFVGAGNQYKYYKIEKTNFKGGVYYDFDVTQCTPGTVYPCESCTDTTYNDNGNLIPICSHGRVNGVPDYKNIGELDLSGSLSGTNACSLNINPSNSMQRDRIVCNGYQYYTAYYFILDETQLSSTSNNMPTLSKFTPNRTQESDQGSEDSNPIIGRAWNQGVFFAYEDNYKNPLFDIYLKAAGGAVIGKPEIKADLNCDGKVDVQDFGILLSHWEKTEPPANLEHYANAGCAGTNTPEKNLDLNCGTKIVNNQVVRDIKIDGADLGSLLSCWGTPDPNVSSVCYGTLTCQ